ncbi:MAG: ABC-F family ATP-binding cassette domain-containing protein [Synergistales bacterium]
MTLTIRNLSLRYGEKILFDNIGWTLSDRARVGLVGDNGTGKSTLLKAILGRAQVDSGSIEIPRGARLGYLPQDLVELGDGSVMDTLRQRCGVAELETDLAECEASLAALGEESPELPETLARHERLIQAHAALDAYAFEARARRVLKGLGFADGDADRPCGTFSGGWKMRIALSALLLQDPEILLLDEPTNHLDTESMEWLETFLKNSRCTLVTVSHDRRFLDNVATTIAELCRGNLTLYPGDYEAFLRQRDEREERRAREAEAQKEVIEKAERFISRFRYKATKAAQVQSRVRMLEKMETIRIDAPPPTVAFRFPAPPRSGLLVLKGSQLGKDYGGKHVFAGVDLEIRRGEKIALVGVNGAGKSTLSRLLAGVEKPDSGTVTRGHGVKLAFYAQEMADNMATEGTVWDEACSVLSKTTPQERRDLLGAFLFSGDDIVKPVRVLSGGEKARLALLKVLLTESNVLVLDEPTNHLDPSTKERFQKALLDYAGTLVLVSHDRHFLDRLVERVVEIRGGQARIFLGNYSDFIAKRGKIAPEAEPEPERDQRQIPDSGIELPNRPQERWGPLPDETENPVRRANRLKKEKTALSKRLETLEDEISDREDEKARVGAALCDPHVHTDPDRMRDLAGEMADLEQALADLMERWEGLSGEIESLDEALESIANR